MTDQDSGCLSDGLGLPVAIAIHDGEVAFQGAPDAQLANTGLEVIT